MRDKDERGVVTRVSDKLSAIVCGLKGHTDILHREPGRLALRCMDCQRQTPGWVIAEGRQK